jgi:hypothetical protein
VRLTLTVQRVEMDGVRRQHTSRIEEEDRGRECSVAAQRHLYLCRITRNAGAISRAKARRASINNAIGTRAEPLEVELDHTAVTSRLSWSDERRLAEIIFKRDALHPLGSVLAVELSSRQQCDGGRVSLERLARERVHLHERDLSSSLTVQDELEPRVLPVHDR